MVIIKPYELPEPAQFINPLPLYCDTTCMTWIDGAVKLSKSDLFCARRFLWLENSCAQKCAQKCHKNENKASNRNYGIFYRLCLYSPFLPSFTFFMHRHTPACLSLLVNLSAWHLFKFQVKVMAI